MEKNRGGGGVRGWTGIEVLGIESLRAVEL